MEKWDCYWSCEGEKKVGDEYFPELYCRFNEIEPCAQCEICTRYVRRDKLDDYIRHLLEVIELLEELP